MVAAVTVVTLVSAVVLVVVKFVAAKKITAVIKHFVLFNFTKLEKYIITLTCKI